MGRQWQEWDLARSEASPWTSVVHLDAQYVTSYNHWCLGVSLAHASLPAGFCASISRDSTLWKAVPAAHLALELCGQNSSPQTKPGPRRNPAFVSMSTKLPVKNSLSHYFFRHVSGWAFQVCWNRVPGHTQSFVQYIQCSLHWSNAHEMSSTTVLFLYFLQADIQRLKSQSCPWIPPPCLHLPFAPHLLSIQLQGSKPLLCSWGLSFHSFSAWLPCF